MEASERYALFVACMAAHLNGDKVSPPTMTAPEWGKLYALARRQSLSGALYTALDTKALPEPVDDRLRHDAFVMLARFEAQKSAVEDIARVFSAKEIAHLFFKGAVVRWYYPDPAMRSMGDIDMAVHETDRSRADSAMREIGFERSSETVEVWTYLRDGVMVEMHTTVRQYSVKKQTTVPYETLWIDARQQKGCTFHLSDEAEATHAMMHLAAHFCAGGCGLRQVMDVAVLCRRFEEKALWEAVLERLRSEGVDVFARQLLWMCRQWFGVSVAQELVTPPDAAVVEAFLERLLSEGTFGTDQRMALADRRKAQRRGKGGKLERTWHTLFPPVAELKRRYTYVVRHPWLAPASYVHRAVDGVTKNRRLHEARRQYEKAHEDDFADEVALFEALGL